MLILSEALHHLPLEQFLLSVDGSKYNMLLQCLEDLELSISKTDNLNDAQNTWKECRELSAAFISDLEHFIHQASTCNEQFRYCSTFLDELIPVITDLTLSFRESN